MTPGFPREFQPTVLKTPPDPVGLCVRDYHPLWCIVPDDFRLAFRYRSVGFQHHISLAGFGLNSVVFDRLY